MGWMMAKMYKRADVFSLEILNTKHKQISKTRLIKCRPKFTTTMRFTTILHFGLAAFAGASAYKFERLDKEKALVLIVDHQVGLFGLVHDIEQPTFYQSMLAHAAMANLFDLPVVMTTSAETGPNGPLPAEIRALHPSAPLIKRNGEVNAWDDPKFRAAVKATNRTQIIIGGIMTDVCTAFLALSLREAGYSVWANAEASGTSSALVRDVSNARMAQAGVQVVSTYAVLGDLMRDWRHKPGAKEVFPWMARWMPGLGMAMKGHEAAVEEGELMPGEKGLNDVEGVCEYQKEAKEL